MRMLITGGLVARADGVFNTDILIEDDRILELGERLHETQQPEGTEIVDVSGCVVMPGGIDAHTHVNLTAGGPGKATMTLTHYIYNISFVETPKFNYAAALSVFILVVVAVLSAIQMKVGDKRD